MNVEFHPEAEVEFIGAVDYYEAHEGNVGLAFAREIRATILRTWIIPPRGQASKPLSDAA